MAYSVQQRTREMAVRIALGAAASDVRNMVVWQGLRVALAGVAGGLAGAFALTRLLSGFLFGVTAHDPATFILVPLLLTGVALVGVSLPAFRAARVDPIVALRSE
jgi:putative ABC transport system permease protein